MTLSEGWALLIIVIGLVALGIWLFVRRLGKREKWPGFKLAERMLFSVPVLRYGKKCWYPDGTIIKRLRGGPESYIIAVRGSTPEELEGNFRRTLGTGKAHGWW